MTNVQNVSSLKQKKLRMYVGKMEVQDEIAQFACSRCSFPKDGLDECVNCGGVKKCVTVN